MRTLTTSSCHSANRDGSVTYEKTSSGGRAISMLDTMGGIVPAPRCSPTLSGFARHRYDGNRTKGCDRGRRSLREGARAVDPTANAYVTPRRPLVTWAGFRPSLL